MLEKHTFDDCSLGRYGANGLTGSQARPGRLRGGSLSGLPGLRWSDSELTL
jgi:hypothetical protein